MSGENTTQPGTLTGALARFYDEKSDSLSLVSIGAVSIYRTPSLRDGVATCVMSSTTNIVRVGSVCHSFVLEL